MGFYPSRFFFQAQSHSAVLIISITPRHVLLLHQVVKRIHYITMLSSTSRTRSRSNPRSMRKTTNPTLLSLLPENVLFNITSHLNPPDVYLFNQLFPEVTQPVASVLSDRNFLTLDDPVYYQQKPDPEVVHTVNAATHLSIYDCCMQESQARSLVRVLNATSPSVFTFEKTKQLAAAMRDINNPRQRSPSRPNAEILMSGSVPLQAVLGRVFDTKSRWYPASDVDLFVSRDALPEVRETMVALGLRCHQVSNRYGFAGFGPQLIGHIEAYVVDIDPNGDQAPYVTASSLAKDHRRRMRNTLRPGISYKNRLRNSAVNDVGIVRPGHEDEDFHRFPPDHPFTPDADFHNVKVVEVIVAKDGFSPQDIIANFDIEACKVCFDGERFGNVNDMIYSNMSDWNRNWHPWINYYIPLCIPEVNDISRRTSPKKPLDKARLFLKDKFFENDDTKLLWIMGAFSQAHLDNSHCGIPCLEHGFNNCECTLVSQTSSHFFDTFHHKVVKQFLRGLKYVDRGIDLPISPELKEAFLGRAAVRKLAQDKAKMTLLAQSLKKIKQEREMEERIREDRAKRTPQERARARMSPEEKEQANAKERAARVQHRAEMSPEEKGQVRANDREAKAEKRAARANAKARGARAQKKAKTGAKLPPDLVEAWLIKEEARANAKRREAAAQRRAEMSPAEEDQVMANDRKAKAHKTTKTSSAKKPEPTKVTPEKSAKLSPEEMKELCLAKRKLALTEEAEANSMRREQ